MLRHIVLALLVTTSFLVFSIKEVQSQRPQRGGNRGHFNRHGVGQTKTPIQHPQKGYKRGRLNLPHRILPRVFPHNPYFHIITSQNLAWSREEGWHASEDEYQNEEHSEEEEEEEEDEEDAEDESETVERENWKSHGSFTGDLRISCMNSQKKSNTKSRSATDSCSEGIVEMYHKEYEQWGLVCADTWKIGSAKVVCKYLNFKKGRASKIPGYELPIALVDSPRFLREVSCKGDEWTLTECPGEKIKQNYTCRNTKYAAVKCSGNVRKELEQTCASSSLKCELGDRCIEASYVCDGMSDCPWGTDEQSCSEASCKKDQYWCGPSGGGCISNRFLCDGDNNCVDNGDETDCEQYLESFTKTENHRKRKNKYEVAWENTNPYLCAQKCKEEDSFVCTGFDFQKKREICNLISSTPTLNLKYHKVWDHYERESMEDCTIANKYRCADGSCITIDKVCDGRNDCPGGREEKECKPLLVRLVGGSDSSEGHVEVSKGLKFGLICDTHWTMSEANVVCHQLGFRLGASRALKGGSFQRSDRTYYLDNVFCNGFESNLENCRHNGWSTTSCTVDHEAGVVCQKNSLIASPTPTTAPSPTSPETNIGIRLRECGVKPKAAVDVGPLARVVGGSRTTPHEWPWQVGIWLPWTYWCGGSLIDPCWVLTAAHCFARQYSLDQYTITLGDHAAKMDDGTEQNFKIARVIKHDYDSETKDNDIALIQLQSEKGRCAQINNEVSLICLPKSTNQFSGSDICHISGWGKTSSTDTLPYSPVLLEAPIPIISNDSCESDTVYTGLLTRNMLCAGYLAGGVDTCQGDSGGPLSCQDSNSLYYVWGIVSWGNGCAKPKSPGIYTKVANYIGWIERNTGIDF